MTHPQEPRDVLARALGSEERVTCICGRSVLPENWSNHLLSQEGRHGAPESLDAAWAEAEAVLPERGWWLSLSRDTAGPYRATATDLTFRRGLLAEEATTPAAALRALAAKLREVTAR